jgi:hypothetical protein
MTDETKPITNGICKNCGASKDLHNAVTNQCPSGGVEITFAEIQMGYMQEWERDTFEDQGIATFIWAAPQQIESLQQKLQAAEKQTAELQQEVERLKREYNLQGDTLAGCKVLLYKVNEDNNRLRNVLESVHAYAKEWGYVTMTALINEALNPQQDEKGR